MCHCPSHLKIWPVLTSLNSAIVPILQPGRPGVQPSRHLLGREHRLELDLSVLLVGWNGQHTILAVEADSATLSDQVKVHHGCLGSLWRIPSAIVTIS